MSIRMWPPTFTNGLQNSINGNDIPNAEGSNLNKAQALLDTEDGLLGGGPTANQGAGGGGINGGAPNGASSPGGGTGPGGSGGLEGGQGTPGGRTTMGTCGKSTEPPAPDPQDPYNRGASKDQMNSGGNAGSNGQYGANMPGDTNQTCNGLLKLFYMLLGCPDCPKP